MSTLQPMTTLLALAVTTTATMAIVSILLMCAKKKKRANKGKRKARKQARGKSKLVRDHKTVQPKNPSKGDVNVQMVTETDTGKTEKEVSLIAAPKKEEATQDLSKEQANTAMTSLMDVDLSEENAGPRVFDLDEKARQIKEQGLTHDQTKDPYPTIEQMLSIRENSLE